MVLKRARFIHIVSGWTSIWPLSLVMMRWLGICCWLAVAAGSKVEPSNRQLPNFAKTHPHPIGHLTLKSGAPVDIRDTASTNDELESNEFFLDTMQSFDHERIPERFVHAKGFGARGYFEVTHDVSKYTKIDALNGIGKKTPVFTRFSIALQEIGGSDFERETRAIAMKFYTKEGNLDLLTLNVPVFSLRDPVDFPSLNRIFKRNPRTNLIDNTMGLDFITLKPNALQPFLWTQSDFGIPRGYRKMDAFPIHAYELYNEKGDIYYARFNFRSAQGLDNFTSTEAGEFRARDLDYFNRDLYNAIENKDYPVWYLELYVVSKQELKHLDFDPFDMTLLWPKGSYRVVPVGRLVINENVDNQYATSELSAFCPSNIVPGTTGSPDQIFKARRFAYKDAQIHRLGINFDKIAINCPMYARTYNRDGKPPVLDNMRDAPNYYPNAYHGPLPSVDKAKPIDKLIPVASNAVDLKGSTYFYNHILTTEAERQRLADNLGTLLAGIDPPIQRRSIKLFSDVDEDLGRRVEVSLEAAIIRLKIQRSREEARDEAVREIRYHELEHEPENHL